LRGTEVQPGVGMFALKFVPMKPAKTSILSDFDPRPPAARRERIAVERQPANFS
jgi:hypothetical protein